MSGLRKAAAGAVIGVLCGAVVGYGELMIRYRECGLGLAQFPFLLAGRALLGGAIGVLVQRRGNVRLRVAIPVALIGIMAPVEIINRIFFGRG